jgi:hypothetical protein
MDIGVDTTTGAAQRLLFFSVTHQTPPNEEDESGSP